jgi:glycosyltransferase involved in cell wall biosynthesis
MRCIAPALDEHDEERLMRILHVNKFLYRRGGAEAYMLDLAEAQAQAGHEVAFYGMRHPENPALPFQGAFPPLVELEPAPRSLRRRVTATGRMLYSPSSRRGIEEVLRAFQPDVAHLHNIYHQLSPSVLRPLRDLGVPTVMTLHDYKLICPTYLLLDHGRPCEACLDGRFRHAVRRRCKDGSLGASAVLALESTVHRATHAYDPVRVFICPSRFLASKVAQAGVYPDRLRVLSNFIDTEGITPKRQPGGGIVYVGRLRHEKGVDVLVEAMGRLGHNRLDLVGDGPERSRLEALATAHAPGRVRFHGSVPKGRVADLLRSAAVAVLPSRCHENQPMAVLEAFACGVPVVATNLGGLPELVHAGRYGETVPAEDPVALAAAVARLLADPAEAFAKGQAARRHAEEQFSPKRHLERLEEAYRSAAAGDRPE